MTRAGASLALLALGASSCASVAWSAGGDPERLYRVHCSSCHRLRDPAEHTRERWAWAMDRYGARAHLAEPDRPRVLAWLQERAADGR